MSGIAAVLVLYNPPDEVHDNIASYLEDVDRLYIVDNSVGAGFAVDSPLHSREKIIYLRNDGNLGIATGLNMGAERARDAGFHFLLTMDQDSTAAPGMVAEMLRCLDHMDESRIGMVSPFHLTGSGRRPPTDSACEEVMTPMTSGCLLNLAAYRAVGRFRDDFFIDFVDNEYCLRLRSRGYHVMRANRALLQHSVGDTKKYGPFIATNHAPLRRYYKTRNRFQVFSEYLRLFPLHCMFDMVRLLKEIGSIVLFEDEKGGKLRMIWRGYLDYRRGRFGRYEERM